jgi:hypothetical protein
MTHSRPSVPVAALAVFASIAVLNISCGGPAAVTPPTTLPPTTTPTTTVPTPPVAVCALGQGDAYADCDRTRSRLLQAVEGAIDLLIEQRPQLFDLNDEYAPGTRAYKVLDRDGYLSGIVANLQVAALCAERDVDDPAQELIFVKDSNDYSEEFDALLSTGHMRRGVGAYRSTCTPASFPVERGPDAPPVGSGCHRPFPPEIWKMACKEHIRGAEYSTLDSTPLVLDPMYCASIGFPDRPDCPVRPEGHPEREACENYRVGNATDTGLPGPTWRKADGSFCTGPDSGCQHGEDSHYQLYAYVSGTYTVCAKTGSCCSLTISR